MAKRVYRRVTLDINVGVSTSFPEGFETSEAEIKESFDDYFGTPSYVCSKVTIEDVEAPTLEEKIFGEVSQYMTDVEATLLTPALIKAFKEVTDDN